MIRGTLFVGCISTDNYNSIQLTFPDTGEKFIAVRVNGMLLGEKKREMNQK